MSTVTKCDLCGSVVKHEASKRLKLYSVAQDHSLLRNEKELDLCGACAARLYAFIDGMKEEE